LALLVAMALTGALAIAGSSPAVLPRASAAPGDAMITIVQRTVGNTTDRFDFTANLPSDGTFDPAGGGATTSTGFSLAQDATYTVTVPAFGSGEQAPVTITQPVGDDGWLPPGPSGDRWRPVGVPACSTTGSPDGTGAQLDMSTGAVRIDAIDPQAHLTCTFTTTRQAVPDVAWSAYKQSDPSYTGEPVDVLPGATITYDLYVANTGTHVLNDLNLTDDLGELTDHVTLPPEFPSGGGTIAKPSDPACQNGARLDIASFQVQDRSYTDADGLDAQAPCGEAPGVPVSQRGTVTISADHQSLSWHVPTLAPGQRLRLNFTVTVNDEAFGVDLGNSLLAGSPDASTPPADTCAEGSPASQQYPCVTEHRTPERPSLTLRKQVTNSHAGSAAPTDWDQLLQARTGTEDWLSFDDDQTRASLPVGTYELREQSAPELAGYVLTDLSCTGFSTPVDAQHPAPSVANPEVTLAAGDDVVCTFTNSDQPGSITALKVDALDQQPLSGASFELWRDDNDDGVFQPAAGDALVQIPQRTDANGHAVWSDLDWGTYFLREVTPPSGYEPSDLVYDVRVDGSNLSPTITVTDQLSANTPPTSPSTSPTATTSPSTSPTATTSPSTSPTSTTTSPTAASSTPAPASEANTGAALAATGGPGPWIPLGGGLFFALGGILLARTRRHPD